MTAILLNVRNCISGITYYILRCTVAQCKCCCTLKHLTVRITAPHYSVKISSSVQYENQQHHTAWISAPQHCHNGCSRAMSTTKCIFVSTVGPHALHISTKISKLYWRKGSLLCSNNASFLPDSIRLFLTLIEEGTCRGITYDLCHFNLVQFSIMKYWWCN